VLKPTPKHLEHGCACTRNRSCSRATASHRARRWDSEKFKAAVESGASEAELTDLSEEMMNDGAGPPMRASGRSSRCHARAGVTCIFQNTGEEGSDPLRLIKRLARFTFATDLAARPASRPRTRRHRRREEGVPTLSLFQPTNGVPLRQQWESVRDELRPIRISATRRAHDAPDLQLRNPIGDGAGERTMEASRDFGHAVVAEMNRLGVHRGRGAFGLAHEPRSGKGLEETDRRQPHGLRGLYKHFRGKPDETA